jgi:hypothetical protein
MNFKTICGPFIPVKTPMELLKKPSVARKPKLLAQHFFFLKLLEKV